MYKPWWNLLGKISSHKLSFLRQVGNLKIVYILDDNYRIMANSLRCENGTVVIEANVLVLRTCMYKCVEVTCVCSLLSNGSARKRNKMGVCVSEKEEESNCGKFFNSCCILLKDNRVFIILFFQLFCGFFKFSK